MVKRKTYSRQFKLEAIRRLEQGDKAASDLARELGIPRNRLYKWQQDLARQGEAAFGGSGRVSGDPQAEIARLRRELERVTEERDILKKAAQLFAREPR
jgi:transposase